MGVRGLLRQFFHKRVNASGRQSTERHHQNYNGAIIRSIERGTQIDSLHIDANFLLYPIVAYAYGLGEHDTPRNRNRLERMTHDARDLRCFRMIEYALTYIITEVIRPNLLIAIYIDGVVPLAKIDQQRQRRYVNALDLKPGRFFDTAAITPGTTWMLAFNDYMSKAVGRIQKTSVVNNLASNFIYSSHLVPGEGEHKLLQYMRDHSFEMNQMKGVHAIIGGDSDLVLLSMISGIENIYIVTDVTMPIIETSGGGQSVIDIRANPMFEPDVIIVDQLKDGVKFELNNKTSAIYDFVFALSLVGNDFLPRQPSMNDLSGGIDAIMNCLRLMNLTLVEPGVKTVNWINYVKILEALHTGNSNNKIPSELERIVKYNKEIPGYKAPWRPYQAAAKYIQDNSLDNIELYRVFRNAWYNNAMSQFTDVSVSSNDVLNICMDYLYGISWVNKYYTIGHNYITKTWAYGNGYAPLLQDVIHVLKAILEVDLELESLNPKEYEWEEPLTPLHQLIAVMPPASAVYVPVEIRGLWEDISSVSELFAVSAIVDQDGFIPNPRNHSYDGTYKADRNDGSWQGVISIPRVTYELLISAFDLKKFPNEFIDRYSSKNPYVIHTVMKPTTHPTTDVGTTVIHDRRKGGRQKYNDGRGSYHGRTEEKGGRRKYNKYVPNGK